MEGTSHFNLPYVGMGTYNNNNLRVPQFLGASPHLNGEPGHMPANTYYPIGYRMPTTNGYGIPPGPSHLGAHHLAHAENDQFNVLNSDALAPNQAANSSQASHNHNNEHAPQKYGKKDKNSSQEPPQNDDSGSKGRKKWGRKAQAKVEPADKKQGQATSRPRTSKPSGETRPDPNGQPGDIEWYDNQKSEWVPAVLHNDIRADLIQEAVQQYGHYPVHRSRGLDLTDRTAPHGFSLTWEGDRDRWHTIPGDPLNKIKPMGFRPTFTSKDADPPMWKRNGKVVLDHIHHPMKDFQTMPTTFASNTPGWLFVALERLDQRIDRADFWGRLPTTYTSSDGRSQKKIYGLTHVGNVKNRDFLWKQGLPTWNPTASNHEKYDWLNERIQRLKPLSWATNDATQVPPLTKEEHRFVIAINKGAPKNEGCSRYGEGDERRGIMERREKGKVGTTAAKEIIDLESELTDEETTAPPDQQKYSESEQQGYDPVNQQVYAQPNEQTLAQSYQHQHAPQDEQSYALTQHRIADNHAEAFITGALDQALPLSSSAPNQKTPGYTLDLQHEDINEHFPDGIPAHLQQEISGLGTFFSLDGYLDRPETPQGTDEETEIINKVGLNHLNALSAPNDFNYQTASDEDFEAMINDDDFMQKVLDGEMLRNEKDVTGEMATTLSDTFRHNIDAYDFSGAGNTMQQPLIASSYPPADSSTSMHDRSKQIPKQTMASPSTLQKDSRAPNTAVSGKAILDRRTGGHGVELPSKLQGSAPNDHVQPIIGKRQRDTSSDEGESADHTASLERPVRPLKKQRRGEVAPIATMPTAQGASPDPTSGQARSSTSPSTLTGVTSSTEATMTEATSFLDRAPRNAQETFMIDMAIKVTTTTITERLRLWEHDATKKTPLTDRKHSYMARFAELEQYYEAEWEIKSGRPASEYPPEHLSRVDEWEEPWTEPKWW